MYDDDIDPIPYVTFKLVDTDYGISAENVQAMLETPEVTPVPNAPSFVRGIIDVRGQTLPLIDLRLRLGLKSARKELASFISMLKQREQDHLNWLAELEASVKEERPFNLTTDPHACAFGKWYDSFQTENQTLKSILKKFDHPHKAIHGVAHKVKKLTDNGDYESAQAIVDDARDTELAKLIQLFADIADHVYNEAHETVLVLEIRQGLFAVTVDAVTAVETILDENIMKNPTPDVGIEKNRIVTDMGRRTDSDTMIQILDTRQICDLSVVTNTKKPVLV